VDLELSEEHVELRESAIGVLDRYAPLSLARRFLDGTGDAGELWTQIADLGWLGVGLDDDPFGVPGLCLLAEQVGRHVAPTLLLDASLVARVAAACASEWSERVAAGAPTVTLALLEPGGAWSTSALATTAVSDDDGFVVSGAKDGVHHAASAGLIAVVVDVAGSPAIALVEPDAAGVTVMPTAGLDPSCAPAHVALESVRIDASCLLHGAAAASALSQALDIAAVAATAEGLGAASAALELAVAYALEREQYGRPIGGFQALRHLLAEQHFQRETAWATVLYAAAALEERTADAGRAAAVAKASGAAATKSVVEGALQVFGGVGFTREHDLHLLYRRALECAGRFGGTLEHEQRIADELLSPDAALTGP
jgi:alkylation response protein AidB-like acyl-CoA dehydrogenase